MKIRYIAFPVILFISIALMNCGGGKAVQGGLSVTPVIDNTFNANESEARDRLNEIVRGMITSVNNSAEANKNRVEYQRPYYFKEYVNYPGGESAFEINFREIDSRTRPLMAEVHLDKVRYSTHMHRKEASAAGDNVFFRDTGVETLIFEWHNGRWTRMGAIFEAKTTEEYLNGQWVPRREETVRINPSEDRPGWFGRLWERIRGGE